MDQRPIEPGALKPHGFFKENIAALLSFFALVLTSVAAAFPELPFLALPVAFLSVGYVAVMTRRPGPILMALFAAMLPGLLFGSFLPGVLFLNLYVSIASGALLIFTKKTPVFSLLASALAFGICALTSGGLLSRALPALFALPAYLLLALAYKRRERRTIVVLAAQAGLLALLISLTIAYFIKNYGALNRETVLAAMDAFRAQLLESFQSLRTALVSSLTESGLELPAAVATLLEDDTLKSLVQTVTLILPGIAAALCGLAAFFGHSLFLAVRQNQDDEFAKAPESILFALGIPSAVVYLVSLALTIFLDPASLPYAVAENLSIILLLPFCFSGLQRALGLFFLAPKGMRWLFLLFFLSLSCCMSVGVVELLALYAALNTAFAPIRKRIVARRKGPDDKGD